MIRDTDETSTINAGQNITLQLNGYTLGSSTRQKAVITNNGTLTILDNNTQKSGVIENLVGTAIENNGILTIGNNSDSIDNNSPTIIGNKIAIINNQVLNYYDGTIKGRVAIQGDIQSIPQGHTINEIKDGEMIKINLN